MEITVATAAVWLAVSGKEMYERSREVPRGSKLRALTAEEAALDREDWHVDMPKLPSYRMDRWDVWKDKFEAIAGLDHLDEAYRGYAAGGRGGDAPARGRSEQLRRLGDEIARQWQRVWMSNWKVLLE